MKLTESNNHILDIPVAFIIFNRPRLTELVFKSIAKVKPQKLLIVADDPRFPEELENCNQARAVIEKVNWNMTTWYKLKESNLFKFIFEDYAEKKYWTYIFDLMYSGRLDTWDYPWYYACLTDKGLAVTPKRNLISNIGFGKNATHTFLLTPYTELPIYDLTEEIRHPPYIIPNKDADNYIFNHYSDGKKIKNFPKNIYSI